MTKYAIVPVEWLANLSVSTIFPDRPSLPPLDAEMLAALELAKLHKDDKFAPNRRELARALLRAAGEETT